MLRNLFLLMTMCLFSSAVLAAEAEMNARDLAALIVEGKAPVIVDVRSEAEYRSGHVPGALHIPFWKAYWKSDEIPASGDDPVVVYCAHGPRAGVAGWALQMAGIPNIVYLKGHMTGWNKARLPTVQGVTPTAQAKE